MIVFPNAKINLGLHVLEKRTDGYHNLETLFYPIAWEDALEIIIADRYKQQETAFTSSGINIDVAPSGNLCIRAYELLKQSFDLPPVNMHLHKTIPSGAGLGGGSADAAFTLRLLNRMFSLQLSQQALIDHALQLGSDCPFFIINKPCIGQGRGEKLTPVDISLSGYKIILINPGIHVPTKTAFSNMQPDNTRPPLSGIIHRPIVEWKDTLVNDFEKTVFKEFPAIKEIKQKLYESGAVYASMTGSGSTVFGFYEKDRIPYLQFPPTYIVKII